MSATQGNVRVAGIVALFESLTLADVARLGRYYADDAHFKDPFNDVRGIAQVQRVFTHMFGALDEPRFKVTETIVQGDQCFLTWEFLFSRKRGATAMQTIRGGSHLVFDDHGLVALHRDYWDAAEELYEKLPVVGALMRWLKRRANG